MTSIWVISFVLLEAVAIVFAFRAVANARTPQGSVAWVVFLVAAPYLAVPAYLFLGHSKFEGYVVARRVSKEVIEGVANSRLVHPPAGLSEQAVVYSAFERTANTPVVSGNGMDLLIDGKQTFDAIFDALETAQNYVLFQSYIISDDELGKAMQTRLLACAKRGVKVRVLFDSVGCSKLPDSYLQALSEGGVDVMDAHALQGPKTRFQLNFRNHRKTIIVDGTIGFIGGLNVADEYMGRDPTFGRWRDTHSRLTGPVVSQLQLIFVEDWSWAKEENLIPVLNWVSGRVEDGMDAMIMPTGPADEMETGSLYFSAAISAARNRVWIATPYFVPENDIMINLKLAAMRGVDVRILMPEVADHKITWLAAFAYFDELMDTGVQIWRYTAGFMHQKVLLVDDTIASVGTTNLDNRSCRLNFEATAIFFDRRATEPLAAMLEQDFENAELLTQKLAEQPFSIRWGSVGARLFAPLL